MEINVIPPVSSFCPICNNPASNICSGCLSISYCSVEHQKEHWKIHSIECKIFTIKSNEKYGRYVTASKDIQSGTIIMNEPVLTYGPKRTGKPLCLGCHKLLFEQYCQGTSSKKSIYKCSKCLFPLCNPECEKASIHAENECHIFQSYKLPFPRITDFSSHHPIYECILPLRCLLLKKSNPKKWKKLTAMMHRNEARQKVTDVWYRNHVNIVQFLIDHCQMGEQFTELEIHTVIGYIDVNAFEIIVNGNDVAALFHNIYIMSHECVSNTHHTFNPIEFRMIVRASIPIKQGEQITSLYANILEGTKDRNQFLKDSKYFDCTCPRCIDPTELGTYFSAVRCQNKNCSNNNSNNNNSYLVPINSLDMKSVWKCLNCEGILSVEAINKIIEPIKDELKKREKNFNHKDVIKKLENSLQKFNRILHPKHYLLVQLGFTLIGFYGKTGKKLKMDELKKIEELCEYLLKVLNVISPGISRLRGTTLYELQEAILCQVKKQLENNSNIAATAKLQLNERLCYVILLLEESYKILNLDPLQTNEGQLANTIPKKVEEVKSMIQHT